MPAHAYRVSFILFYFLFFCGARNGPPRAGVDLVRALHLSHILSPRLNIEKSRYANFKLRVSAQCTLVQWLLVYNLRDTFKGHLVHLILLHINFFYLKNF